MPRRGRIDHDAIAATAAAQHRCITLSQLAEAGMGPGSVADRTRPVGGRWTRLLPGVVLLHTGRPSADERAHAALLYGGPDAVLTGAEALRRWSLHPEPTDDRVHLLVPDPRRRKDAGYVICERTTSMPASVRDRSGLPLAPVARALVDGARHQPSLVRTRAVVAEAVQRRLVREEEVLQAISKGQRRRTARIRLVAAEILAGVRSVAEADFRTLVLRAGHRPLWNHDLLLPDGEFLACPDAWFDDAGLAVEVDSRTWHMTPEGWERTQRKLAAYARNGIPVMPVTPARLRADGAAVLRDLDAALTAASRAPRPDVRAVMRSQAACRPQVRWG
jgi:hypothetical protein